MLQLKKFIKLSILIAAFQIFATTSAVAEDTYHEVIIPDHQPYYQFYHENVEYVIWLWLEDSTKNPYQMSLSEVVLVQGGYGVKTVVASSAWQKNITTAGGAKQFMTDVFVPKINLYLEAQGGNSLPDTFPEDGIYSEQINWLIENAIEYSNGRIVLGFIHKLTEYDFDVNYPALNLGCVEFA